MARAWKDGGRGASRRVSPPPRRSPSSSPPRPPPAPGGSTAASRRLPPPSLAEIGPGAEWARRSAEEDVLVRLQPEQHRRRRDAKRVAPGTWFRLPDEAQPQ